MIKTALILAAGRGERLRPLTDNIAKSMCIVQGRPLIEHHVIRLAEAGFTHVVINHAYLGSQIRQHLQQGQNFGVKITYSAEPPGALETAGAIIQALPLLGSSPFITLSADIFTDYPFAKLSLSKTQAHIVLAPTQSYIPKGDFGLNQQGYICATPNTHTFANIACFDPALFQNQPLRRFPLGTFLRELINKQQVTGEIYEGKWINIGEIEQLQEANRLTLNTSI